MHAVHHPLLQQVKVTLLFSISDTEEFDKEVKIRGH